MNDSIQNLEKCEERRQRVESLISLGRNCMDCIIFMFIAKILLRPDEHIQPMKKKSTSKKNLSKIDKYHKVSKCKIYFISINHKFLII